MCTAPGGTVYIADMMNNRIPKVIQLTHTPSFAFGKDQSIIPCPGHAMSLDSQMAITDADTGQTETWTMVSAPVHGSLIGFPITATSVGTASIVVPSGISYIAPGSYLGADSFKVRVSDGLLSDTVTMYVSVQPGSAGSISGTTNVCPGAVTTLSETIPGGTWGASNANATIDPVAGAITGATAGTDTITYAVTVRCYVTTSIVVTIDPLPASGIVSGPDNLCAGASTLFTETVSGGVWSSIDTTLATVSTTGMVTGVAYGTAFVEYTTSNAWCSADSVLIYKTPGFFMK